ncbi:MAG: MFS transporter [Planctomycetia bacterium]|nr:MAG: MFS transporter [Planctomycetia bacterium]
MATAAFTLNRAEVVDQNFVALCKQFSAGCGMQPRRSPDEPLFRDTPDLTGRVLRELFESQIISRHLDLITRALRRLNRTFYTIGSSGHEGVAVLGRLLRHSDPAFLHYRDGALLAERSRQTPQVDFVRDTLLSFMAARAEPISGGRHKVWGSVPMCVLPQTSTIASHPPKSVGAAMAIERSRRQGRRPVCGAFGELPPDSIVLCTFGDASINHSVAQGAFNTAAYATFQNLPVPVLFVCEDNGIGISVHTAPGWVEASFSNRTGIRYFAGDGLDLVSAYRAAAEAVHFVRSARRPALLHLKTVRLMGHAGTDPETEYHTLEQITAAEARDPLLASARLMIESGFMTGPEVLELYEETRRRVQSTSEALGDAAQLTSAEEVIAPLAPHDPDAVAREAARTATPEARLHAFALDSTPGFLKSADGPRLPESQPPRHLAVLLNWALRDLLTKHPEMSVFGEDVAARGGVYYVTAGLSARFGLGRVFNTLLDETSILGMAIGAGHLGMLPVPEIQYLAYVHNAIDQLRGEACSASFFSNGQFPNPMVVRIQSLGYQKGFGGHFHNDNSIAALRDIPGLVVAIPSRGDDAARMLRTCLALARVHGRVVAFLEPIALYMTKDLHETGDGAWLCRYPAPDQFIPLGESALYRWNGSAFAPTATDGCREPDGPGNEKDDLTIITYGNGVHMSLRAALELRRSHDLRARVVDLRWVSPLNEALIEQQARATGRVLCVDEGRRSGGVAESVLSLIAERCGGTVAVARLTGHDTYIPLGPAANLVLPTEQDVVRDAVALCAARERAALPGTRR